MIKRELYLPRIREFYNSDLVKILVGIRRCGKSVILKQIIDEIKKSKVDDKHIIYINFEYIEYEELKDYRKLNSYIKDKLKDKMKYYIFLDEIQKVDKFEHDTSIPLVDTYAKLVKALKMTEKETYKELMKIIEEKAH